MKFRYSSNLILAIFVPLLLFSALLAIFFQNYFQYLIVPTIVAILVAIYLFFTNVKTIKLNTIKHFFSKQLLLIQLILIGLSIGLLLAQQILAKQTLVLTIPNKWFLFLTNCLPWVLASLVIIALNKIKAQKKPGVELILLKQSIYGKSRLADILAIGTNLYGRQIILLMVVCYFILPLASLMYLWLSYNCTFNINSLLFFILVLVLINLNIYHLNIQKIWRRSISIHRVMLWCLVIVFLLELLLTPIFNWLLTGNFFIKQHANLILSTTKNLPTSIALLNWGLAFGLTQWLVTSAQKYVADNPCVIILQLIFMPVLLYALVFLPKYNTYIFVNILQHQIWLILYLLLILMIAIVAYYRNSTISAYLKNVFYEDFNQKKQKLGFQLYQKILQFVIITTLLFNLLGLYGFAVFVFAMTFGFLIFYGYLLGYLLKKPTI